MKVSWAGQSDLPGKISRHFINKALEEVIAEINVEKDIVESDEEIQGGIALDHDRKDLPGSPDLAAEISKRIENAAVFVCRRNYVMAHPIEKVVFEALPVTLSS